MEPQTKRRFERLINRMNAEAANHAAIMEQITFHNQGQKARDIENARHDARMGDL